MARLRIFRSDDWVWRVELHDDNGQRSFRVYCKERCLVHGIRTVDDLDRCLRLASQGQVSVVDLTKT